MQLYRGLDGQSLRTGERKATLSILNLNFSLRSGQRTAFTRNLVGYYLQVAYQTRLASDIGLIIGLIVGGVLLLTLIGQLCHMTGFL